MFDGIICGNLQPPEPNAHPSEDTCGSPSGQTPYKCLSWKRMSKGVLQCNGYQSASRPASQPSADHSSLRPVSSPPPSPINWLTYFLHPVGFSAPTVSISQSTSPALNSSPTCFNHWAMLPWKGGKGWRGGGSRGGDGKEEEEGEGMEHRWHDQKRPTMERLMDNQSKPPKLFIKGLSQAEASAATPCLSCHLRLWSTGGRTATTEDKGRVEEGRKDS